MRTKKILTELKTISEDDYKKFNSGIIPTKQKMLGVRLPLLRKLAKKIIKDDAESFINADKQNIYEMIMLEGIVLSYLNKPFSELLPLIENYLSKTDNWAQVDSVIQNFKSVKKEKDFALKVIKKWLKSNNEFIVRAGIVMLMSYYIENDNLEMIFSLSENIKHEGYYVYMANAWIISVCMIKFPEKTTEFFKNNNLDDKTHNKAIQKSMESYRVSKEDKEIIKKLKRK